MTLVLPSIMLDIQYRMHPSISRFPSAEFYNRTVRDGTVDAQGYISSHLLPPQSAIFPELTELIRSHDLNHKPSIVFLDHVGTESKKDRSRVNWNEAHIVCSVVEDLLLRNPVRLSLVEYRRTDTNTNHFIQSNYAVRT